MRRTFGKTCGRIGSQSRQSASTFGSLRDGDRSKDGRLSGGRENGQPDALTTIHHGKAGETIGLGHFSDLALPSGVRTDLYKCSPCRVSRF